MRFKAECETIISATKVKVKDANRKAVFINLNGEYYLVIKMDGCVVTNSLSADWIVSRSGIGDIVIEFKGRDVEYAVKQVMATAAYLTSGKFREGSIAGLIVCRQYPKFNTAIQRAKSCFARLYRGPLHVVTKNYEYEFANVLSFNGPFKL